MNQVRDFLEKMTASDLPAGALLGVAIVLLLIAVKVTKGFGKAVLVVLALAALAGAAWWYFQRR